MDKPKIEYITSSPPSLEEMEKLESMYWNDTYSIEEGYTMTIDWPKLKYVRYDIINT